MTVSVNLGNTVQPSTLMGNKYLEIAATDSVKRVQQRLSSQTAYARRKGGPTIHRRLETENLPSKVERAIIIQVEAFDWNCSQYIVPRFSQHEVRDLLQPLKQRINELETRIRNQQSRTGNPRSSR